ncbi:hypothetical protein BCV72DRAFT_214575, partial [Rhizopus microsporus var. microsporus]
VFTRIHVIQCLHMRRRLFMSQTIEDPLSFLIFTHEFLHSSLVYCMYHLS